MGSAPVAVDLRAVSVRPLTRRERADAITLLRAHHYLGFRGVVGETVWHVAEFGGEWVALLVWAAAAFKCAARDSWIGWHPTIAFQRLHLVANNVRFLILPGVEVAHLASRVLGLSARRLSEDWQRGWGHPILLVETFVDPTRFRGTCYRAAGWSVLGQTRGFARQSGGWRRHGIAKLVFCRELIRGARHLLSDPTPGHPLNQGIAKMKLRVDEIESLFELLRRIPDPRKRRGVRHAKSTVLAICVAAVLSGMRSYEAMAQWARDCTQDERARFRCRWSKRMGRYEAPSEPTIRRILSSIDAEQVDRILGSWLEKLSGDANGAIAIDGKTLRGARRRDGNQVHLLSAVLQSTGTTIAQVEVQSKSNEIPAARQMLAPMDLEGRCITADALHTQRDLASFLVEEKRADYLLVVKDNQPTLRQDIRTLLDLEPFPPSGGGAREEPRSH
jgi:DDE_Tnp_1-associated/Druantia protein DruA/Transposase DDE domain